jgi:hypothetical protein
MVLVYTLGKEMDSLERVREQVVRYDHLLLEFEARRGEGGGVELRIRLKQAVEGAHEYIAPVHERDIAHPQFPWTFQKFLYDCLHDYLCELFLRNPQMKGEGA